MEGSQSPPEPRRWLSTGDVATEIGVTQRTVYGFLTRGELTGYRFGRVLRVRADDLNAFVDRCRLEPGDLDHLTGNTPAGDEPDDGPMRDSDDPD